MSFDAPLLLLALPPAAALVVLVHRWGLAAVGPRQRRVALGLRLTIVAALVLALAGLRVDLARDDLAVVFLVDRSDSMGVAGGQRALAEIDAALERKARGDRVAIVAFGREPRLEFTFTQTPALDRLTAAPDATATDLARALQLAGALFDDGELRRVVVLSDGRETTGDARREAEDLARRGIVVEGITIEPASGDDTALEALEAPATVARGAGYQVAARIRSPGGRAVLELFRDGRRVARRTLDLRPGHTTVGFGQRAGAPGLHRYEARVTAVTDALPQNDRATAGVIVQGPPAVLLVHEGPFRERRPLMRALRAGRIAVEVAHPLSLPALDELLRFRSVILVDVPAFRLRADAVARLRSAVVDAGLGLVTVGGDSSYGLGGYHDHPLEEILPVDAELTDPERRPPVAQALVIDTSGSMGLENGINKTDISRAGAAGAIASLLPEDQVGVLTFNTNSTWLLPIRPKPGAEEVEAALAAMTPDGGTEIGQAVVRATEGLADVRATIKHIILFTDGHADDSRLIPLAADAKRRGITLSIVAIGQSPATVLPEMAVAGGGRYYEGTSITDVPEILTEEAILASRNYINEGLFRPVITADTELTRATRAAPPLRGYVATSPKAAATVELAVGEERDPLLARWRAGLGTVTSWTSDAFERWSRAWVGWGGYRDFWTRVARSTFPPGGPSEIGFETVLDGDRLRLRVSAERPFAARTEVSARVLDPQLRAIDVELSRVAPGTFEAAVPIGSEGIYVVAASVSEDGRIRFRGRIAATVPSSPEYLEAGADPTLIGDLAALAGGRDRFTAEGSFDRAGLRARGGGRPMWPWLTLLASVLLPADVAARRLIVTREDLRRARAAMGRRRADEHANTGVRELLRARRG